MGDEAGIKGATANATSASHFPRYDLNGRKMAGASRRGINLLRMSDGTVRKVLVK